MVPLAWVIRTRGAPMSLSSAIQHELARGEWRPTGGARTHDGRDPIAIDGRRELQCAGAHDVRGSALLLAAIGVYGLIGVLRGPARAGNRHPPGPGSGIEPHPTHGDASGAAACSDRCRVRPRRSLRLDPRNRQFSLWCEALGSPGLFYSSADLVRRCPRCRMVAGAAREPGRPHLRTAARLAFGKQQRPLNVVSG